MYYTIKQEKLNELKEGKMNSYIADLTHYSRQYITYIFKGQIHINLSTAIKIVSALATESIKLNKMINEQGKLPTVEYFFEEVK